MTQRERVAAGLLYAEMGEGMAEERAKAKELAFDYNNTRPSNRDELEKIAREMFGSIGEKFWIEAPVHVAYGCNTHIGTDFYANFNLVLVDDYEIIIGDRVLIAPNVVISTSGHPIDPELRCSGRQYSFPVKIEDEVWIGSGAVINPGVTIGHGSVIGAGSVVTKDIPPMVVAVGNPCRVLREINERDKVYYYKDYRADM